MEWKLEPLRNMITTRKYHSEAGSGGNNMASLFFLPPNILHVPPIGQKEDRKQGRLRNAVFRRLENSPESKQANVIFS